MEWVDEGIVLGVRRHGEGAAIVEIVLALSAAQVINIAVPVRALRRISFLPRLAASQPRFNRLSLRVRHERAG